MQSVQNICKPEIWNSNILIIVDVKLHVCQCLTPPCDDTGVEPDSEDMLTVCCGLEPVRVWATVL